MRMQGNVLRFLMLKSHFSWYITKGRYDLRVIRNFLGYTNLYFILPDGIIPIVHPTLLCSFGFHHIFLVSVEFLVTVFFFNVSVIFSVRYSLSFLFTRFRVINHRTCRFFSKFLLYLVLNSVNSTFCSILNIRLQITTLETVICYNQNIYLIFRNVKPCFTTLR